jgi:hypothetical protein
VSAVTAFTGDSEVSVGLVVRATEKLHLNIDNVRRQWLVSCHLPHICTTADAAHPTAQRAQQRCGLDERQRWGEVRRRDKRRNAEPHTGAASMALALPHTHKLEDARVFSALSTHITTRGQAHASQIAHKRSSRRGRCNGSSVSGLREGKRVLSSPSTEVVRGHTIIVNERVDKVMCVSSRCGAPVEAVVELLP